MDLLARFGRASSEVTKRTCIVIVEVQGLDAEGEGERQVIGVVVDAVNEVLEIDAGEIEPPPAFGARIRTDFIQGMGKVRGKFVILLDVDHVLSLDEVSAAASVIERAALETAAPVAA
jgi:purine-binding chemotaxis protein CheW